MKRMFGFALVLVILTALRGQACTTPVYRYAMYNWAPEPYRVFYVHRGDPGKEDETVNRKIAELADALPHEVNVAFESIDLDAHSPDKLPASIQRVWESQKDEASPTHLVFSPWGVELFSGRLDSKTLEAMVDSPVRMRMSEMLDSGQVAVLLLLAGADAAENERAEQVVAEVIRRAAAGELPGEAPPAAGEPETDQTKPPRWDLGLVKLSRADPAEKWLVRSLTTIEPDLNEKPLADQPMVFAVYGRGRAMPPFVGKGITAENLADMVLFLSGACSCLVKDQNPGVDLLVHWDWEATAERMAADEGSPRFQPAYVEFAVGASENSMADTAEPNVEPEAERQPAGGDSQDAVETAMTDTPVCCKAMAASTKTAPTPDDDSSSANLALRRLGVGFVAAAVAVVLIGFVLIRKRTTSI